MSETAGYPSEKAKQDPTNRIPNNPVENGKDHTPQNGDKLNGDDHFDMNSSGYAHLEDQINGEDAAEKKVHPPCNGVEGSGQKKVPQVESCFTLIAPENSQGNFLAEW